MLIRGSTFKDDVSQHRDKEQRAKIVALECTLFELDNVTISISAPTLYKLSLHNLLLKNVAGSGLALTCGGWLAKTTDSEIYLRGVRCV